ncbi:hypothetical protein D1007_23814 [Hordeum vulgare]|nr:hypothetical protein D1007_23814 [Hordeum vulgare]
MIVKDEKLCIVDIKDNAIVSWLLDDGSVVERWIAYKNFPLRPIVKELTRSSVEEEDSIVKVSLVAVIDGFVYLSIFYLQDTKEYCELYLSICLETSDMCEFYKDAYRHNEASHPYVMAWPPSLLQSKEESETEDDDPKDTEETSSVLIAALQSFSQALMNADIEKEIVAELHAFLRPTKDDKGSLISRITTSDAQMTTARNRILRISE